MVIAVIAIAACATRRGTLTTPAETTRHRAALAIITVVNNSEAPLAIAFRTASPPLQEIVIGKVSSGQRTTMAPVPAGEPLILVARRSDGAEYQVPPRSFALDAEFVWEIPRDATFLMPERRN